jgi:hypothetical protein
MNDDGLDELRAAALPEDAPGAWIRRAIDASRRGERAATPSDPPCSCGAPARVVFRTGRGDVSWCGVNRV